MHVIFQRKLHLKAIFVLKKKASSFKFNMVADEELSIAVEQFDVLYDKSHQDFHRKDIKSNACKAVAEKLGLEDGKFLKKDQKFQLH